MEILSIRGMLDLALYLVFLEFSKPSVFDSLIGKEDRKSFLFFFPSFCKPLQIFNVTL